MRSEEFGGIRVELGANWIQSVDKANSEKYRTNPIWDLKNRCGLEGDFSDYRYGASVAIYKGDTQVAAPTVERIDRELK